MEKVPHILIMSSWYPTKKNPFLGNFVKRHAELIASKYKVTVLKIESNSAISKITIDQTEQGNLTEIMVEYPHSSNLILKWLHIRKAFKKGVKKIQKVDLIHASNILSDGYQFLWAKKHFKKPLIITEHGSYYRSEVSSNWSFKERLIIHQVLKKAALITAVSPFLKSEMERQFPKLKVQILPNFVDQSIFKFKEKEPKSKVQFVHISTLDERFKNISGILDACETLHKAGNLFEFQIISDESFEKWQKIVHQKGLNDSVHFSGPLQPNEVASIIQASHALILFSNYETFSCVIAESWSTGTPVITTPVGIAQNLDKELGLQVEIQNVNSLVHAMEQFIKLETDFNPSQIQQKSNSYNRKTVLELIDQFYQKIITPNIL